MKKITVVWTIVMLSIFTCLYIVGNIIKNNNINKIMEESLKHQAEKFLGAHTELAPKNGSKLRVTAAEITDEGYNVELKDGCTGYVIIEPYSIAFKYNSFIKCPDYITEGYQEK